MVGKLKSVLFLAMCLVLASCAHKKAVAPEPYPTIQQFNECCMQDQESCASAVIPPVLLPPLHGMMTGGMVQVIYVKNCNERQFVFVLSQAPQPDRTSAETALERYFALRTLDLMQVDAHIIGTHSTIQKVESETGLIELHMTIFELKSNSAEGNKE